MSRRQARDGWPKEPKGVCLACKSVARLVFARYYPGELPNIVYIHHATPAGEKCDGSGKPAPDDCRLDEKIPSQIPRRLPTKNRDTSLRL